MKNHYDVLRLEKDCKDEEIRDSYIKLSKEFHPDKNKSSNAHRMFVEVNEAYSVLGKRATRRNYDEHLSFVEIKKRNAERAERSKSSSSYNYYNHHKQRMQKNPFQMPPFFSSKSNVSILLCYCILVVFGVGLQVHSTWKAKMQGYHRSQIISLLLENSRKKARAVGKDQAIKSFMSGDNKEVSFLEMEKKIEKERKDKI